MQSKIYRAHQSLDVFLKRQEKGLKEEEDDPGTDSATPPGGGTNAKSNS